MQDKIPGPMGARLLSSSGLGLGNLIDERAENGELDLSRLHLCLGALDFCTKSLSTPGEGMVLGP